MSESTVFKTGSSVAIDKCQVCGSQNLKLILFLGYLPPVNEFKTVGSKIEEQPSYPANVVMCQDCKLMQLGCIVDAKILFPSSYPYTSSTTKILRDNFAELYSEMSKLFQLKKDDLVIDVGSNDGNLLTNFKDNHKVLGITPEEIGKLAIEKGIPTIIDYFTSDVVDKVIKEYGHARVVTATNVFAHIEHINNVVQNVKKLLTDDGIFACEVTYVKSTLEKLQYDTVYHEHLLYYSLYSLKSLLDRHGLEVIYAKQIPTHGGSLRIYASHKGKYPVNSNVEQVLESEKEIALNPERLDKFKEEVMLSKLELYKLIEEIKKKGQKIIGISAPSRASTLINYVGLDEDIISYIVETPGSHKIGKYIPGTLIPVVNEEIMYKEQPEYALLFSWHIADELIPKIKAKGYNGKFIVPLPVPKII